MAKRERTKGQTFLSTSHLTTVYLVYILDLVTMLRGKAPWKGRGIIIVVETGHM